MRHHTAFYSHPDWKQKILEVMYKHSSTINLLTHLESDAYAWKNFHKSGEAHGNIEKLFMGAPEPLCKPP